MLAEPLRVMIVECDAEAASLMTQVLTTGGFAVHCDVVESAAAFESLIGANVYDVIVAAYQFPGWSATDAVLRLREHLRSNVPFVVVAETLSADDAAAALGAGMAACVLRKHIGRVPAAVTAAVAARRAGVKRRRPLT